MTIYRTNDVTKWSQAVLDNSYTLPGLEAMTGADLLISPLTEPRMSIANESLPSRMALEKHLQNGLLVQVKRGRDFTGSIPSLPEILQRMLEHTPRPWLLIIADLKCDREGQCIIDGSESGFTFNAVDGAICWWQLRGGMVSILNRDSLIAPWVNCWLERLNALHKEPSKSLVHHIQQVIAKPDWKNTLATFPGIGMDRACAIAGSQGTLANSLMWLSDEESISFCKIPGVGLKTIQAARQWLGLSDNQILMPITKDEKETSE